MADAKSLVANLSIDTGDSRQNLEELQASLVATGASGVESASEITSGLQKIEQQSGKLTATIDSGGRVSESSLQALAAKYVGLQDAATQAYGSLEKAPVELQNALQIAQDQIVAVNTRVIEMGTRAQEASAQFRALAQAAVDGTQQTADGATAAATATEAIGTAATGAGAAAADATATIAQGMISVADASKLVDNSVTAAWEHDAEGGRITARQIAAVAQNVERLRLAIIDEAGSFANANADMVAGYTDAQARLAGLVTRARDLNEAAQGSAIGMKDAGGQLMMMGLMAEQAGTKIGGVGEILGKTAGEAGQAAFMIDMMSKSFAGMNLNTLGGSLGTVATQIGLVAATLVASVAAGVKFAETNEGNAQSVRDFEKSLTDLFSGQSTLGAWLGKIQADFQVLISRVVEAAQGMEAFNEAVMSGDWSGAEKALNDVTNSTKNLSAEMKVAEKAQADAQQQAIGAAAAEADQKKGTDAHTTSVKSLADETAKLTSVEQIHGAIMASGVNGQRIWSELNVTSTTTLEQLRAKIEEYDKAFAKATETVKAHEEELKNQIEAEKSLIKAHDAEITKIGEMVASINGEDAARKRLHETQLGELNDAAKHEIAANGTSASIKEVAANVEKLSAAYDANKPALDDEIARLDALGKSTIDLSADTKKHIDAVAEANKQITDATAANKALQASEEALLATGASQTAAGIAQYQALQQQISANDDLIARGKDVISSQSAQISGTEESTAMWIPATAAAEKHAEASDKVATATQKTATSLDELATKAIPAGTAITIVGDATEKATDPAKVFGDMVASLGEKAKASADNVQPMIDKLASLTNQLNTATSAANAFSSAMAAMDAATKNAAGGAAPGTAPGYGKLGPAQ